MKLTVLGSGTLIPFPNRGNSGYFLQTDNHNILIDGGSGALRQMATLGLDYRTIDVITYTHLHPDHTLDMIPLLFTFKHDSRVTIPRSLKIMGPPGFKSYFQKLMDIYGDWVMPVGLDIEIQEVLRENVVLEELEIACGHSEHTEHSVTYRFTAPGGEDIFYSGDTGKSRELIENAKDVSVLILECSFPDDDRHEKHLTPTLCGEIASECRCKRLILTHFYPEVLETDIVTVVSRFFNGTIDLAYDGMEVEI
ncbi:MAG: MBL fold metallo-hydrolase [Candidatus Neomarinimicrobiota bacterium]